MKNKYILFITVFLAAFFVYAPKAFATNSAPVLDSSKSPVLANVNEDSPDPAGAVGTLVSSLVDLTTPAGGLDNVTDADGGSIGIAVTGASSTNITCYFTLDGGSSWSLIGIVNSSAALLLAADADNRIYCKPNANFNGTVPDALTFRAWDLTSGTDGQSNVDTAINGGTTAFSVATDTAALVVLPQNDAPVLDATKSPTLSSVAENAGAPSGAVGTLVSELVDFMPPAGGLDNVTDADSGASLGIAITDKDSDLTCYYSLDGGSTWFALGTPSIASSRLLASNASNRIYCIAGPNQNGTYSSALTIRAWDRTSGSDGTTTSTISSGGTTAFSTATDTVSLIVTADPGPFITTWKTDNVGTSNSNQITIPAASSVGNNYDVDWGDSSSSTGVTGPTTHTYSASGTYTVRISGTFKGMFFVLDGDRLKLLSVEQWGTDAQWSSMSGAFFGASNMVINATDAPDLSSVTDMQYAFRSTSNLGSPDLSGWDVSNVTSFLGTFQDSNFNGDITTWDTSSAETTSAMFYNDASFNQNLSGWDVSSVSDMNGMFVGASAFNSPLTWGVKTANVTNMSSMFLGAGAFNQDISGWDTSSVMDMSYMFNDATSFNQDINSWDVSIVTDMTGMFANATSFDQDLGSWDVQQVENMEQMFSGDTLSTSNYDAILNGWAQLASLTTGVTLDAGSSTFCDTESRAILTDDVFWDITDGGIGDCDFELTEVTPLAASLSPGDAVYYFAANQAVNDAIDNFLGGYEVDAPDCDHCNVTFDTTAHTVTFTDLVGEDEIDVNLRFNSNNNTTSNDLEIGPARVKGGSSSSGGGYYSKPTVTTNTPSCQNGKLIKYPSSPTVYVIDNCQKRAFESGDDFIRLGYSWANIVVVSDTETYVGGTNITGPISTLPTPAAAQITINLGLGMTNPQVIILQQLLQAKGFFPSTQTPIDHFGPITFTSVKAYQAANGIIQTGFVGPLTRAKLNS